MEAHELLREALHNEITTKNSRLNWLFVTQSFIFAAFGIMLKQISPIANYNTNIATTDYHTLVSLIPMFGAALTILTIFGISGCYIAIYVLNKKYKEKIAIINNDKDTLEILIFKGQWSFGIGILYSYSLCILFLLMWYKLYCITSHCS